jgi:YesN/AraC family two-component response regulator
MSEEPHPVVCSRCGGTGWELESTPELAASCRQCRVDAGLSLRRVANRMGISAVYLSDLERNNRRWTFSLLLRNRVAVQGGKK